MQKKSQYLDIYLALRELQQIDIQTHAHTHR